MASRRVAKTIVDWAAFAERVPPAERDIFRAFKAKSTNFLTKVHQYPEALPAIDFAQYKKLLPNPAIVDAFEKNYKALSVPYPTDKDKVLDAVTKEEATVNESIKDQVAEFQRMAADAQLMLDKIDTVPKPEAMTHEMFADYFPESAVNPDKPTLYPHTKPYQPENIKDFLK
ncbi:mitochondrial ATP synthase subunit d precursor [Octopus vulgaris]|uniref:Mitochondrial ATP synthase subunit d n=2 Tax=Octopus TaxID=6643 RepID=A0AA36B6T3_OCTVU|nr:ATP synthase subunit d, mitochondrial [Octopus sinensis]CAI9728955.1 mitochondrial ATP synthase subunit d precursor [Octopus vulgaris]